MSASDNERSSDWIEKIFDEKAKKMLEKAKSFIEKDLKIAKDNLMALQVKNKALELMLSKKVIIKNTEFSKVKR